MITPPAIAAPSTISASSAERRRYSHTRIPIGITTIRIWANPIERVPDGVREFGEELDEVARHVADAVRERGRERQQDREHDRPHHEPDDVARMTTPEPAVGLTATRATTTSSRFESRARSSSSGGASTVNRAPRGTRRPPDRRRPATCSGRTTAGRRHGRDPHRGRRAPAQRSSAPSWSGRLDEPVRGRRPAGSMASVEKATVGQRWNPPSPTVAGPIRRTSSRSASASSSSGVSESSCCCHRLETDAVAVSQPVGRRTAVVTDGAARHSPSTAPATPTCAWSGPAGFNRLSATVSLKKWLWFGNSSSRPLRTTIRPWWTE